MFHHGDVDQLPRHVIDQLSQVASVGGGRDVHFHIHFPGWNAKSSGDDGCNNDDVDWTTLVKSRLDNELRVVGAKFVDGIQAYLSLIARDAALLHFERPTKRQ